MRTIEEYVTHELARLVAIPSVSGNEMPCIVYLEHLLAELGFQPLRQQVDRHRANLIVPPRRQPALLLTAHVDTVSDFGHPELFLPRVEDGYLYGRGAADVKGGVVAILGALRLALAEQVPLDHIAIAFTVDEEQGGQGSEVLPKAVEAAAAIVMEPTNLTPCPVATGSIEAEFHVSGYACHGGMFEAGTNAIDKAIALIQALRSAFCGRRSHPILGSSGFNIMQMVGGSEALRVPDECRFLIDLRILPGDDVDELLGRLQNLAAMHDARLHVRDVSACFEVPVDSPVVVLLQDAVEAVLGQRPAIGGIQSWTDAEPLVRSGIPAVVFGPGELRDAHTERERVPLSQVASAARVLFEVIRRAPKALAAPS